jgi:serine/threonine-protein kinase PknG
LHPGDLVAGQYEVAGCLAHGGLGWIYLARDRNVSDRWVVLKGLLNSGDPDAYAAAIAERRFLAEVQHPLIVEIYNFVMHEGAGYIVMEYVGGTSLKGLLTERMARAGGAVDPIPTDQAIAYMIEVLPAFQYLHEHGMLYCDFKPDNIIQIGDAIKLIDLGGVRRVDDDASAIYGTVGYQAPEVPHVGPSVASDIYTVGRTLISLAMEFRGNTSTYVASLPPVNETPLFQRYDSLYRLLAKACAPDPADRFTSADEMRVQLLGVLREVVAANNPGAGELHSVASVLFDPPPYSGQRLNWWELPALRVDDADRHAAWLSGVSVADARARLEVLRKAPEPSVEVRLAIARTAIDAERFDVVDASVGEILAEDPWEWRAVWVSGLASMAAEEPAAAQAAFNTVYGQAPGELAPKLALALACEAGGEPDVAEGLYQICARTDANYAAAAAFGMARIRETRGDIDGAIAALDVVPPASRAYALARQDRARLLAGSGRGLDALAAALASVESVPLDPVVRSRLRVEVLSAALHEVSSGIGAPPRTGLSIGGVRAEESALRDGLEEAYRTLAGQVGTGDERVRLVDAANRVRRWTLR